MRPSEARGARWAEIEGDVWTIPAERMKGRRGRKRPHTVFLSRQAVEVLEVARALARRTAEFVFASAYGKRSGEAISRAALARTMKIRLAEAGVERAVAHGWRASFSTLMNDRRPELRHVIDAMLAHAAKGVSASESHYRRNTIERAEAQAREVGQEWADWLLEGAPSAWAIVGLPDPRANVVELRRRAA
jgi:integrase